MVVANWEDALEQIKSSDPEQFFLFHFNDGEVELDRTRFMNRLEAMAYCFYKMGRQRIGL